MRHERLVKEQRDVEARLARQANMPNHVGNGSSAGAETAEIQR